MASSQKHLAFHGNLLPKIPWLNSIPNYKYSSHWVLFPPALAVPAYADLEAKVEYDDITISGYGYGARATVICYFRVQNSNSTPASVVADSLFTDANPSSIPVGSDWTTVDAPANTGYSGTGYQVGPYINYYTNPNQSYTVRDLIRNDNTYAIIYNSSSPPFAIW